MNKYILGKEGLFVLFVEAFLKFFRIIFFKYSALDIMISKLLVSCRLVVVVN